MAEPESDIPSDLYVDRTFLSEVFKNTIMHVPNSDAELEHLDTLYSQERENPTPVRLSSIPPSPADHHPANSTVLEEDAASLEFPRIPSHLASPIKPGEYTFRSEPRISQNMASRQLSSQRRRSRSRFESPHDPQSREELSEEVPKPKLRKEKLPAKSQRIKNASGPTLWTRAVQLINVVMQVTALVLILTISLLLVSTYLRPQPTTQGTIDSIEFETLREETTQLRAAIDDIAVQINNISQMIPDAEVVQKWESLQWSKNWADIALDAVVIPELTSPPFDPLLHPTSLRGRLTKIVVGWFKDVDFTLDPQSLLLPRSAACWPLPDFGGNVGIRLGAKVVVERVEISSQHPVESEIYFVDDNLSIVHAGAGSHSVQVAENTGVQSLLIKVHPSRVTCLFTIRVIGKLA